MMEYGTDLTCWCVDVARAVVKRHFKAIIPSRVQCVKVLCTGVCYPLGETQSNKVFKSCAVPPTVPCFEATTMERWPALHGEDKTQMEKIACFS